MSDGQELPDSIPDIDAKTDSLLDELSKTFGESVACYPFLNEEITPNIVDKVFDDLQGRFGSGKEGSRLVVVVNSFGGDIDAAYNLAMLFCTYGKKELSFIVPRWAKSAATLLVCGGDSVMMTQVAELGPLDPQITQINPLEQRLEQFSPLHIESTLELIRNEFDKGNKELAEGLLQRLQFPITLGSIKKSLQVGKQYASKLLASRMLKDDRDQASKIANKLVEHYADHGHCINIDEVEELGLVVHRLSQCQVRIVWDIYRLARKKADLKAAQREKEMEEQLRELPPNLQDALPPEILKQEPRPDVRKEQ